MAATACIASFMAVTASANGRFPRAQRVTEAPGHPEKLAILGTYGLLVTEDRGKTWYYVCDAAFTYQVPFASDAVMSITSEGSLWFGVQKSISLSRNWGCDFAKILEPPGQASVDDFTMSPSNTNDALAIVTTFEAGKNTIRVQESLDGGQTWKVIGTPVPADVAYTIDVDPTDSKHIYLTGVHLSSDPNEPALFITSTDLGTSWTTTIITNTNVDSSPWIAAVHPRDGNKIFVRTDSWKKNAAFQDVAGDALLYSENGGKTWTELLRAGGSDPEVPGAKMLGFTLSPDGSTALVGYGDIRDPLRLVDPEGKWFGVYKSSSDGKYSFGPGAPSEPVPVFKTPTTCLAWTGQGIYGCFAPPDQPHYLAFTTDPSFAAGSLATLMKANEVQGSPRCCDGRAVSTCTWAVDCAVLGACDAGAPPDAGVSTCSDAGGAGAGGAGGTTVDASSTGGTGGSGGAPTGGAAGTTGGAGSSSTDGCGCRLSRGRAHGPERNLAWLGAALFASVRGRRRRR